MSEKFGLIMLGRITCIGKHKTKRRSNESISSLKISNATVSCMGLENQRQKKASAMGAFFFLQFLIFFARTIVDRFSEAHYHLYESSKYRGEEGQQPRLISLSPWNSSESTWGKLRYTTNIPIGTSGCFTSLLLWSRKVSDSAIRH